MSTNFSNNFEYRYRSFLVAPLQVGETLTKDRVESAKDARRWFLQRIDHLVNGQVFVLTYDIRPDPTLVPSKV